MDIYGPFPLTMSTIETILTRTMPGLGFLCAKSGEVEKVVHSAFDITEVLHQWVGRYDWFYFCYAQSGSQAESLRKQFTHQSDLMAQ